MSENFNSPSRVLSIMSEAAASDNRTKRTVDVWAEVFSLGNDKSHYTTFQVVNKLELLYKELDRCEILAQEIGVQRERYEGSIGNMRSAVDPNMLAGGWQDYASKFSSADVNVLGFISDLVPSESEVEVNSLKEFSQALEDFKQHVDSLEESMLRDFAARQIANMEQAVSDYPIIGARAFEQAMKDFAGEAFFNYDVWKGNEDTETIDQLRKLGGKLFNIVKYTAPMIQSAAGMKELLGL